MEKVVFETDGVKRSFTVEHANRLILADKSGVWKMVDKKWIVLDGKLVRNKDKSE